MKNCFIYREVFGQVLGVVTTSLLCLMDSLNFFRAIIILVLFGWTWQICWNWDWKSRTNFSLLIDFLSVGWRLVKVLFPFSLWMGIAKELIGNRWLQFCDFEVNPWPIWMKYDEVYGYVGENLKFIDLAQ